MGRIRLRGVFEAKGYFRCVFVFILVCILLWNGYEIFIFVSELVFPIIIVSGMLNYAWILFLCFYSTVYKYRCVIPPFTMSILTLRHLTCYEPYLFSFFLKN
jgi:hypothetical protein